MFNVSLFGRLTADPEVRQTQSGKSVCSFTVAVDDRRGQNDVQTSFVRCVAWNGSGEALGRNFQKGQQIVVCGTGHINQREYNGAKHNDFELTVNNWHFCGGKTSPASAPTPVVNNVSFAPVEENEDLPF